MAAKSFHLLLVGLTALALPALAGTITINFTQGGSYVYSNSGTNPGGLAVNALSPQLVLGTNTTANSGTSVSCLTCQMNLTTGVVGSINALDATHTVWLFTAGGTLVLQGTVPNAGINSATTLFTANIDTPTVVQRTGTIYTYVAASFTITSVNPQLLAFYGENTYSTTGQFNGTFNVNPASPTTFTSSSIQSGSLQFGTSAEPVPEPSTFGLAGVALSAVYCLARRKFRA